MQDEMKIAREAARIGGDVLKQYYNTGAKVRVKEGVDLVTEADVAAEEAIAEFLHRECPGHALLAEEGHAGDVTAEHLWIVDPLDGTTNFAHHIPHFAVSVAYYRSGEPQCGVIGNPIRDDWREAWRGGGAWHNGTRVAVSPADRLDESLIGIGFYYDRSMLMEATLAAVRDLFRQNIHGVRRFGTAALDLCHVGAGYYGAYFEYLLSPWDFAAGRLFVTEAGGVVTTCTGEDLPLRRTHLLASNGKLHAAVLEIVSRHLPEGSR